MKKLLTKATVVVTLLGVAATAAAATFTYDYVLRMGSRGSEVVELQMCLNSLDYNVGVADGVFGPMTLAGVKAFQADHSLTPDGIVGPMTGSALEMACNGSDQGDQGQQGDQGDQGQQGDQGDQGQQGSDNGCQAGWIVNPVTGEPCDSDVAFDGSGDEASFTGSDIDDAPDTSIEEGAQKVELGSFSFKNEDSAVKLEKADIILSATTARDSGDEDDAWKVFKKLYLYVDGDLVASKEVDSRSEWRDRTITTATIQKDEDNRVRFSGLDKVLAKDEEHEVVLKADMENSIDIDNTTAGNPWAWVVDETAFRFVDEAGLTQYLTEEDTNNELVANFTIVEAGNQDELEVRSSSADPEPQTFEVKDTATSDEYLAFAFDVKADADGSDLDVSKFVLTANTGTANFDQVVDEVTLKIAGKEEDYDVSASSNLNSTSATLVFDFDGKEVTIPAGDEETAKVYVRFKSKNGGANYNDGETIQFLVSGANVDAWDVEGEDNLTASQLTGSATGEVHSLYENGVIVTMDSSSVSTTQNNSGQNTKTTYTAKLKVKAFGDTVYFDTVAEEADTASTGSSALAYRIEDGNGASVAVANTTASHVVTTDADLESGSVHRIDSGDEKTITLKVVLDSVTGGMPGFYRLQLKQVRVYKDVSPLANPIVVNLTPEADYETDAEYLEA